ncbi:MAG TPA: hypothetical protein VK025_04910 [Steroidobacter sp.]|nr:hypothetical protein [Steroidobacter sp.]
MHQAIAAWLIQRSWRAAVVSAVCGAFALQMPAPFAILAGAVPTLIALRFGVQSGLIVAAAGAVAATFIVLSVAESGSWLFAVVALMFAAPVLLAALMRNTGSLNLCYQSAALAAAALLIAVYLALPDPVAVWAQLLHQALDSMAAAGFQFEADQDEIVAVWSLTMWGAMAALAFATTFGGFLLGRWWDSLLTSPAGQFGAEYRRLRLGKALGGAATVLFVLALFVHSSLVASLAWVAFAALAFQGLAAAHRMKAGGRLNRGWLAVIYVLLFMPLSTSITVFVLAIWGFADNWLRPRVGQA